MKKVKNKQRKFGATLHYHQVKVNGTYYLFTEKEVEVAKMRAKANPEDIVNQLDKMDLIYIGLGLFFGLVLERIINIF